MSAELIAKIEEKRFLGAIIFCAAAAVTLKTAGVPGFGLLQSSAFCLGIFCLICSVRFYAGLAKTLLKLGGNSRELALGLVLKLGSLGLLIVFLWGAQTEEIVSALLALLMFIPAGLFLALWGDGAGESGAAEPK
jgi:hypothetical protein